jgi:hypothetical protein
MIRGAGILAVAASLVLLGLVLQGLHSAAATATIVGDQGLKVIASRSPGIKTVFLQFHGVPDADVHRRFFEAGIQVPLTSEIEGDPKKTYGVLMAQELANAVVPGDELALHSRRLRLGVGEHFLERIYMWCEVRRGETVRVLDAPENGAFALVIAAIVSGPIALWSFVAGIMVVASALPKPRRGPSTTPPDSRGTPGSP